MRGHAWTLWPFVRDAAVPPRPPPSRPWQVVLEDPDTGPVRLSGSLSEVPGAETIAVLVHGLAGCADASYCCRAAAEARARGMSSLRLNLRGADLRGEDFYHGGLTADLAAAVASPEVARHRRILVLGFSLGGHLALRLAVERPDQVSAVAAVCAPLDLGGACRHIDGWSGAVYRPYLLRGLRAVYEAVAARRAVPTAPGAIRRVRRLRRWDELTVVRRYGFASADDYYQRASVGPLLDRLQVPALFLGADRDPMVPATSLRPHLARASGRLAVRWLEPAGHVGFPGSLAVDRVVFDWLEGAA